LRAKIGKLGNRPRISPDLCKKLLKMPKDPLQKFDYHVECGDFLLYELGRLIDEDRASFEDDEFRRVIEAGIHEHIERRLDVRAAMAMLLRSSGAPPDRTLHAIEDIESPLAAIPPIIHSYTAYLFERLEQCSAAGPDERITTAADTLLDSPEDRARAEACIDLLASIRSAVSARILAHVISEPMLEEDLEMKAYNHVREMWPLPRPYILYSLKQHTHEDLPFRWFQLLIDCNEPPAVDRILEEFVFHGGNPDYREDLLALVQLLEQARDPGTEDKILQVLNSPEAPEATVEILEGFLKNTEAQRHRDTKADSPWASLDRVYAANRRYLAVARLFDAGKRSEAARALEELMQQEPQYPFALMLKRRM
jgi:hypothetical protein